MSLTSSPSQAIRIVAAGVLFGIVGMLLTYERQIGLGFTLFGLIFIGGLLLFARTQQIVPVKRNLIMLVPVVFFTIMLTIRSSGDLATLNIGAACGAVLLLAYFFRRDNLLEQGIFQYIAKTIAGGLEICFGPFQQLFQSSKWLAKRPTGWRSVGPVVRGAAITVPVVGVFVLLLSSADEVFARLVRNMLHIFNFSNLGDVTVQSLYVGVIAWGAIGILAVAMLERKVKRTASTASNAANADAESPEADARPAPVLSLGFTESLMVLGSTCAVFATFVVIQFVYLFGGARNIANFSYADYVHRGFAELIIVAVLTLVLELLLNSVTIRRTHSQATIVRGLSTVLILLTGVILLSALQRMRLYDSTYGLTSLRLTIYVFIVWLGLSFVGFTVSLYWMPRSLNVFGITALIVVFGFVATLDLLNPDYFVAWQNISRGDVDPMQLAGLSAEAAPALVTLVDAPDPGLRTIVRYTLVNYRADVESQGGDWRDFNADQSQTVAVLQSVKDRLDNASDARSVKHSAAEVEQLHSGMTVREVTRQLGYPWTQSEYGGEFYGAYSSDDNTLALTYALDDGRYVKLSFGTSTGLTSYGCYLQESYGECSSYLKLVH